MTTPIDFHTRKLNLTTLFFSHKDIMNETTYDEDDLVLACCEFNVRYVFFFFFFLFDLPIPPIHFIDYP